MSSLSINKQSEKGNKKKLSPNEVENEQEEKYSKQFYDGGTACQGKPGIKRQALVSFKCDLENRIEDVVEVEVVCQNNILYFNGSLLLFLLLLLI